MNISPTITKEILKLAPARRHKMPSLPPREAINYHPPIGGARGVMVIIVGNGHGYTSSTLDEADCISHSTNTLGKGMNPIILSPAMGK